MKAFLIIFAAYALLAVLILRWMELSTKNRPKFGTKPTSVTLEEVAESYKNAKVLSRRERANENTNQD